jgi:hypothetical protein
MKTNPIVTLAMIAVLAGTSLQAAPPVSTTAQWEAAVVAREQRVKLLHDELKELDSRIEGRVDVIVGALRSIGDSKDSRTKVARMKEDTIERLTKSISYYQTKRATLLEELRKPTLRLTEEQKRKGVAAFDARIDKRVTQILTVQKSLPGHKDYARYNATGSDWNGNTTYEDNEDYRQNQRVTAHTDMQRKDVVKKLEESIKRLEQQSRALKASNAPAPEISRNEQLLAERRKQRAEALKPTASATRGVGKNEAHDLDKALQTAISELSYDFTTLFARYSAYLRELSDLNRARAALAAKPKAS